MIRKICSERGKGYEAAPLYPSGALLWASFLSAVKIVFCFSRQHPPSENLIVISMGAFVGTPWNNPSYILNELIQKYPGVLVPLVRLPSEATSFLSGLTVFVWLIWSQ